MTVDLAPNADLIGQAGSRWQLATPALVLDLDRFEENVARMAGFCQTRDIALRPHAKSHKSVDIAQCQLAAGAVGICCATIGEAEVMAAGGISNLLITSPTAGDAKVARLARLNASASRLMAVCDDPDSAAAFNQAAAEADAPLKLLVDVDIGHRRTGVASAEAAIDLARLVDAASHLEFAGVQAYGGHLQHMEFSLRETAAAEASEQLRYVIDELAAVDLPPGIVTGAGTGTFEIDSELAVYTELQTGSYIFMDVEYADRALWPDGRPPFEAALFVQMTVTSANWSGQATTDAGLKAFATDGPLPVLARGAPKGSLYKFAGDEFGRIELPPGEVLALGTAIECMVPHCDPTVNLYDYYHCVRGDTLVDIWPIGARGK